MTESDYKVELANEGKALAEQCGAYIEKLRKQAKTEFPAGDGEAFSMGVDLDQLWIRIGATDLQRGFMAVIRGIEQPTTF